MEPVLPDNRILIPPAVCLRRGWAEAFRVMAEWGDDQMLDEDLTGLSSWDEEEWEW